MRTALSVATVLVLVGAPALASDHHVPQSTLSAVGLADMEVLSDAEGEEVRGMKNSMAMGLSLVSGLIIDPTGKSFLFGSDSNAAMAGGRHSLTQQVSAISLNLHIPPGPSHPGFTGGIIGAAGGTAFAK